MQRRIYIGVYASILLLLLLSMPLLGTYNSAELWNGLPLSLVVLFGIWILIVLISYGISTLKNRKK